MKVQERDLELVRWVNGFGFVEVESVSLFWGVSYDVARARLAKLVKGGLLVSERGLTTGKLVFWPSGEGLELAGDEMRAVKAIRWATAGHDLAVQRLSVRLERETGGRFEPERRLRRRRGMQGVGVVGHVPDGVLHLEAGKPVAIEVEFAVKPKARLRGIFEGYRRSFDYSAVWWFPGSEAVRARLVEAAGDDGLFVVKEVLQ